MSFLEIAQHIGGEIVGPPGDCPIRGVTTLEEAQPGWMSFISNPRYLAAAQASRASGFLVTRETVVPERPCIVLDNVWRGMIFLLERFHVPPPPPAQIHPTAVLSANVEIGADVAVGPHAVIEDNVAIGDRTRISAQCFVGRGTRVGRDSLLHPGVCVLHNCEIGDRVILHPGVVIGADGFKYEIIDSRLTKIPQVGRVVIEDDVEIGANTCIDRASLTETRICRGAKIDNLVQIAHNVRVGRGTILVSQVGIAGSTRVGDHCMLGGQVGLADNLTIGDGVKIGAQAGVKDNLAAGGYYIGAPAVPVREFANMLADMKKLPEIRKRLRELEKHLTTNFTNRTNPNKEKKPEK